MSKARAKGTAAESMVVDLLRRCGFPYAERRALAGVNDKGDISGIPGVVIEVKNCTTMQLAEWMGETIEEGRNAGAPIHVCWHKRRGKSNPLDWYVTMPGSVFLRLLAEDGQVAEGESQSTSRLDSNPVTMRD